MKSIWKRNRVVRAGIVAAALAVAWTFGSPLFAYLFGDEVIVEAQLRGEACGSHLAWDPKTLDLPAGTRVRFVNSTRYWSIPLVVQRESGESGRIPTAGEKPSRLAPGEAESIVLWSPGRYRMDSGDPIQRLAGLQGEIRVTGFLSWLPWP